MREWLAQFGFTDPAGVTEEIVDVYTTCAQQYGAEHAIANLHAGRLSFDFSARAQSLTQPLTLLWSDSSPAFPLEWARRLCELGKNCTMRVLQNVGPLAALEAPEQVIAALREQLQSELRVL